MSQIDYQLNDFQNSVSSIEQKFGLIKKSLKETIGDYNIGVKLLNQSCANNNKNDQDINSFKEKIFETIIVESESMKGSLTELIRIRNNCLEFQDKEHSLRRKFKEDPDNFDEKNLKELIQFKANDKEINDQIYKEIGEMIENAKNSKFDEDEDIVMDAPTTQVVKCPITGKPIEDMVKNTTCDHVYERSAILHHLKSTRHKKCPFAGCKQNVQLEK